MNDRRLAFVHEPVEWMRFAPIEALSNRERPIGRNRAAVWIQPDELMGRGWGAGHAGPPPAVPAPSAGALHGRPALNRVAGRVPQE